MSLRQKHLRKSHFESRYKNILTNDIYTKYSKYLEISRILMFKGAQAFWLS